MTIFFTADSHYWHTRLLELADERKRFATVEEMNETMIERWNSRVGADDVVYHLGDFSFGGTQRSAEVYQRLHGTKHLILGNHDQKRKPIARMFDSAQDYLALRDGEMRLVLFHFPILEWYGAHKGAIHLHGHTHGNLSPETANGPRIDVGVDVHGFTPISLEEVLDLAAAMPEFTPLSHHMKERQ